MTASIVDRLVRRHAAEMTAGHSPALWRFTPETHAQLARECAGLWAVGCPDVSSTTFLGIPFEVGPIAHDQPFTLE